MEAIEINTGVEVKNPLEKIVEQLEFQKKIKRDFVVPSDHIRYNGLTGLLSAGVENQWSLTEHCHSQVANKLEIPMGYYKRMKGDHPDLLALNINGWLSRKEKTKYLLRTFNYGDENITNLCRAMLSDRYSILDNWDVLIAALEAIKNTGIHVDVVKAEVTERKMYLHIVAPEIHVDATELLDGYLEDTTSAVLNNGIISGLVLTNSEVGLSRFEVSARAQILRCKNGLHDRNAAFRKTHLGAKMDEGFVQWSEGTKQKNYQLILSQVADAVKVYMSKEYLGNLTSKLLKHKYDKIENPKDVIEVVSAEIGIPESHQQSILKYFYKDQDESSFGLMNAFTREAQNVNADLGYEIESTVFDLLPKFHKFDQQISSKN